MNSIDPAWLDMMLARGVDPQTLRDTAIAEGATEEQWGAAWSSTQYYQNIVNAPIEQPIGDDSGPSYIPGGDGMTYDYQAEPFAGNDYVPPTDPASFDVNASQQQQAQDEVAARQAQGIADAAAGATPAGPAITPPPVFDLAADTAATEGVGGAGMPVTAPVGGTLPDATGGAGNAGAGGGAGAPTTGVPSAGNAPVGGQTAPGSTAGQGGNTAPGAGQAGQGQGDFAVNGGRPDPANPNDQSWMNFNKGAGGMLSPNPLYPTVGNSATGIVQRDANTPLTAQQAKLGVIGRKPGMLSV